ncbi:MAG: subtilisin family serine protease [Saprospiraceae bacterium]|jgi:subtilisin family serine protease
MKFQFKISIALMMLFCINTAFANYVNPTDSVAPENWFNLDVSKDGVRGVSTEAAYSTLLKGKTSRTVVVAVIDSGIDIEHEDLKDIIWINTGEIPNNGKDDDGNGYVDDVHGWNFIGGKDGEHVDYDTYEITRLYKMYSDEFQDMSKDDVKGRKAKKRYATYLEIKDAFEKASKPAVAQYNQLTMIVEVTNLVKKELGDKELNKENVAAIETEDEKLKGGVEMMSRLLQSYDGETIEGFKGYLDSYKERVEYGYNPDFNPRGIVGDDYENSKERYYGNNDVEGPHADHGTHVAGIIGAVRGNDVGMDGVADNVRIMAVRTVPNGDERDKDVANAIIYAVDNGASVINMSFGKSYSYDEKSVEKAIKYARKKDVLLVHAAGNSAQNNDVDGNFPNDLLGKKGKEAANWLEIGASNWGKGGNDLATFSNYGQEQVDVFAPGVDLYATVPQSDYRSMSGTSMASPVVAGVAALLRSYYPALTAAQVKSIIMESAIVMDEDVNKPGSDEMVKLSELSRTGGVINVVEAVKLAEKTKGKKKVKKP